MKVFFLLIFYTGLVFSLFLSAQELTSMQLFNMWKSFKTPTAGPVNVIGSTSAGCLKGAFELKQIDFGKVIPGYVVMKTSRGRYFAHPDTLKVVEELGHFAIEKKFAPVLIGDLSQARGGPFLNGHASHQTGLDVDIRFQLPGHQLKKSDVERLSAPSFVKGNNVIRAWTKKQTEMVSWLAQNPKVDRIFVNPVIKRYLCKDSSHHSWLQKVRPWWGHQDHLHVRLKCPADMKLCQQQDLIPAGNGCEGADIEWWFSEEAQLELQKRAGPKEFPKLPSECLPLTQ